jgi:hypothetical protein
MEWAWRELADNVLVVFQIGKPQQRCKIFVFVLRGV